MKEVTSLGELYRMGKNILKASGIENPGLEAELLISKALGVKLIDIYAHPEKEGEEEKVSRFKELLRRRSRCEPIAYILGEKEFYSRTFLVTPDVLIPRPETEVLVEEAISLLKDKENRITSTSETLFILDVGTGSGCIAVTLAAEVENINVNVNVNVNVNIKVLATDISLEALNVAKENAKRQGASNKVFFLLSGSFDLFRERIFDLIISNPPYISWAEFLALPPDVRNYEPKAALIVGEDGLSYIKEIVFGSKRVLREGGSCMVEVGWDQSDKVIEIFEKAGFREVAVVKDFSGIERVVKGRL